MIASGVRVEVGTLREAITIAHPVRHGRSRPGDLQQRHIDALLALDDHPRLRGVADQQVDADYARDKARDLWLQDNAADYLRLLTEDEIHRRVEAAGDYEPAPGGAERSLQDCPVCGHDTLIPTGIDDFGIGIAVGTCFVCGYWRSPRIVAKRTWFTYPDARPDGRSLIPPAQQHQRGITCESCSRDARLAR